MTILLLEILVYELSILERQKLRAYFFVIEEEN